VQIEPNRKPSPWVVRWFAETSLGLASTNGETKTSLAQQTSGFKTEFETKTSLDATNTP
jgi:hypothetical protein